ncbi:inosine/guanosine kinase [Rouxiella badensis]|jgi:inosine kinase|uniref:Guanosine-inosine kinase n=1 Tax=Rouxiella badensis TaxID=1646377 RepID=A0A1X0WJ61_9GAMM|nr:inosine/guanosine kinase [Rouxiella badensis]MCC3717229.1 inosine/guanosine kinase [Rouxiella badensis]MCC3728325.1 inosine/guanosine kinase [Rouxiella badensis]MCC3732229.1 inosine/guanosine kinase [Rouxiella badensis]MCC3740069.1 inosine/guanosine kinase [Rouxiella badensis]MCC3759110.1 inosine/guanosine kinase [Rouxiella badensis]
MKFPGKRKSKHYFPVSARDPLLRDSMLHESVQKNMHTEPEANASYIVGIDQTLVDIEARVDDEVIARYGLVAGQSSLIDDDSAERLYQELVSQSLITHQFAGGTIGNTLHNYSVLADDRSVLLGVMCSNVKIGSYAYRYLCNTSSRTDLDYLQGVDGAIGRCFTLINESGERTFAISPGHMNQLRPESIPEEVIAGASALVLTSYLLRGEAGDPMPEATRQAIKYAKKYQVPVVLTLGTQYVIADDPEGWREFIRENVTILAMNEDEACALTGLGDPLMAVNQALEWADLVLCTAGPSGLYMGSYTEEAFKRATNHPLLPGAIAEFNQYEFSRAMRRESCTQPLKIFSHIAPYMGGPEKIMNTNGAGDGALSALLHDIAANGFHRMSVPNSSKHARDYLTYSSLAQVCKYANRVSYQVLNQHSPRLTRGLPEREDSLEESYWEY